MNFANRKSAAPLLLLALSLAAASAASCGDERPEARSELERRQGSISRQLDRIAEEMEDEARRQRSSSVVEVIEAGANTPILVAELANARGIEVSEAEALLESLPAAVARDLTEDEAEALRRRLAQAGASVRVYSTYRPPEDDI